MRGSLPVDWDVLPEGLLLVAVSGGVDSVVLAHHLHKAGCQIALGHVHHGLREASDREELLVRGLATELAAPIRVVRLNLDPSRKGSFQEMAREERYLALGTMADDLGAVGVVTAHHADDQAETVLMNLARGAGPKGLGGMFAVSSVPGRPDLPLIRPMLELTRAEIVEFAASRSLNWAEDASNQDTKYRRNAVRHRLMPVFHEIFGEGASRAISRSARLLRGYENSELAPMSEKGLNDARQPLEVTFASVEGFLLKGDALRAMQPSLRSRVLLEGLEESGLDASRSEETAQTLVSLLDRQAGRKAEFPGGAVWRERDGLAFVTAADSSPERLEILPGQEGKKYGRLTFRAQSASYYFPAEAWCVALPSSAPCMIRPWGEGDRLALRSGTAKVKDLLTEARVPSFVREMYPVVEQDGVVVWIPYIRAAWISDAQQGGASFVRLSALLD